MPKSHERIYTRQCIGRAWVEKLPIKLIVISTENSEMIMEAITIRTKLKVSRSNSRRSTEIYLVEIRFKHFILYIWYKKSICQSIQTLRIRNFEVALHSNTNYMQTTV